MLKRLTYKALITCLTVALAPLSAQAGYMAAYTGNSGNVSVSVGGLGGAASSSLAVISFAVLNGSNSAGDSYGTGYANFDSTFNPLDGSGGFVTGAGSNLYLYQIVNLNHNSNGNNSGLINNITIALFGNVDISSLGYFENGSTGLAFQYAGPTTVQGSASNSNAYLGGNSGGFLTGVTGVSVVNQTQANPSIPNSADTDFLTFISFGFAGIPHATTSVIFGFTTTNNPTNTAGDAAMTNTRSQTGTGEVPDPTTPASPAPEPSSFYLAGSGLAIAFIFLRFRRKPQLAVAA